MHTNIVTAKVKIRGTRPLLWHHFTEDALPLEKVEKSGVAGNDPTEWRKTVLTTRSRQLFVPPQSVFSCLRDAGKYIKKGRISIMGALAATLQVTDERVLIDRFLPKGDPPRDTSKSVYLDVRSVVNPSTGGRNIRYRVAARTGWTCVFTLLWDSTVVSRNEMQATLRDAGSLVGLGDGRAIGMGRFEVLSFFIKSGGCNRRLSS